MVSFKSIFIILFYIVTNVTGICNNQTGPAGSIQCSLNDGFIKKQWNTCATNNYIQWQSQGRKKCASETDNYCTYACMPEVFSLMDGRVTDVCVCDDSSVPPTSSLPTECFSPDGSNCDWYNNCLERKYSCQDTSVQYLLMYAKIFCNLYVKYNHVFTADGLTWINDGRKCLQLAFVPLIRPFINSTCQDIRGVGLDAFKPCNQRPYPGTGTICNMTRRDWLRGFWMMKREYDISMPTAAYFWLQNALDTFYECQKTPEAADFGYVYQQFKVTIDLIETSWNNPINQNPNQVNQIAIDIGHRIASFLQAPSQRWGWFAYGIPEARQLSSTIYKQMTIALLVADLSGIIDDTLTPPNTEFNELIEHLKFALIKGDLLLQNDNGTFYVSQMSHCLDMKCHATVEPISAPTYVPKNDGSASINCCFSMIIVLFVTWILVAII